MLLGRGSWIQRRKNASPRGEQPWGCLVALKMQLSYFATARRLRNVLGSFRRSSSSLAKIGGEVTSKNIKSSRRMAGEFFKIVRCHIPTAIAEIIHVFAECPYKPII